MVVIVYRGELEWDGSMLTIKRGFFPGRHGTDVVPVRMVTHVHYQRPRWKQPGELRVDTADGRSVTIEFRRRHQVDVEILFQAVSAAAAELRRPPDLPERTRPAP